jgi:hypothetical protein
VRLPDGFPAFSFHQRWGRAPLVPAGLAVNTGTGLALDAEAGLARDIARLAPDKQGESGQISLLVIGFTMLVLLLIVGGVDVTAANLARTRLLDAADAAALDASDAVDIGSAYRGGLKTAVSITDRSVRQSAAEYLAVEPRPHGISSWALSEGTGSPDGQTSVVRLQGTADIPIGASIFSAFGGSVKITVESRARSGLR